ncbi:UDP-N-acetyl-D-mannosamine dehydrogenase [candidate division WWE3 bacterium RBG_19FT_COMBO_53_11]|uniref:UDP-N-acetyl-D-mannosamine dehydrogenase n=1 Tax=candidate division WWE3 bacterium RBG_19FT_COMBO_53_11 TaxID=1802613 RepID=A0A1F4UIV1_UNCKA|nr:MAG: UDP-N-acetyl-D-mannosamine dehydrogenase [candidate division WWE3 bacterium RBG_16_52_45]OGC44891.1 MAG: UDP-N-acetyl-D-mannosamine dehydrogenase [candidate division WWE3 bacterium RBG_19FT_COMBO_53_11]
MVKDKTICVVGLGYIGLPTACLLARFGYKVTGVDINKERVRLLSNRKLPFEEPGLPELFKEAVGNMSFRTEPVPADAFIISVPTPTTENKKPDLTFVEKASKSVSEVVKDGNLVVLESTVPPGTSEKIVLPILLRRRRNIRVYVSHAPERAIPGRTIIEMVENDRAIGGVDRESTVLTGEIYSSFVKGKIHLTDATTAEFVKLIENTFRDVNIAFANELAKLCESIGVDVWEARKLANLHPRVNIHSPGPGVGGHCISVDPWFLVRRGNAGTDMIKLSRKINDSMPHFVIEKVSEMLRDIKNPTVTVLGVAYKGNVDDWRETPALEIIKLAKDRGWEVKIHDPFVRGFPYRVENDFTTAAARSDCLIVVADHSFYKELDPSKIKVMKRKNIFDSRNLINDSAWRSAGFDVEVLGKPSTVSLQSD